MTLLVDATHPDDVDPLTGLPGRTTLGEHLGAARGPVTMLAVDVDDLRRVNTEAGQRAGDLVLRSVAATLQNLVSAGGLVVRLNGDDFAVVVPDAGRPAAQQLAKQISHQVGRPVTVDGRRLHLRANVGIVLGHAATPAGTGDEPGAVVEELLRCTDVALALAQRHPQGIAVHTGQDCRAVPPERLLQKVTDLHAAMAPQATELVVDLQPQFRLTAPMSVPALPVHSCEALVRWWHPTAGLLGPDVVLRVAGVAHLRRRLTARVLDLALAAVATWWPQHPFPVSVNLEAGDLDRPRLAEHVARALERHGLPATALTVEVVEDSLMADPARAARTLRALRDQGCSVAIDDFGTGYSSLAWLHRLPIDVVKFDRSLVSGMAADPAATAIVRHSIRLAHDLGLHVVAEGVEDAADLALLHELGCDRVQGYLTGRPTTVEGWRALLGSAT